MAHPESRERYDRNKENEEHNRRQPRIHLGAESTSDLQNKVMRLLKEHTATTKTPLGSGTTSAQHPWTRGACRRALCCKSCNNENVLKKTSEH